VMCRDVGGIFGEGSMEKELVSIDEIVAHATV
jgi:hypothetical protein